MATISTASSSALVLTMACSAASLMGTPVMVVGVECLETWVILMGLEGSFSGVWEPEPEPDAEPETEETRARTSLENLEKLAVEDLEDRGRLGRPSILKIVIF